MTAPPGRGGAGVVGPAAAPACRPLASLDGSAHAVYRLAAGLLLVFKPRGHREAEHAHEHGQRLRVLRGRLAIRTARRSMILDGGDPPLTLKAGRRHATEALDDTWLIAEVASSRERPRRRSCHAPRR